MRKCKWCGRPNNKGVSDFAIKTPNPYCSDKCETEAKSTGNYKEPKMNIGCVGIILFAVIAVIAGIATQISEEFGSADYTNDNSYPTEDYTNDNYAENEQNQDNETDSENNQKESNDNSRSNEWKSFHNNEIRIKVPPNFKQVSLDDNDKQAFHSTSSFNTYPIMKFSHIDGYRFVVMFRVFKAKNNLGIRYSRQRRSSDTYDYFSKNEFRLSGYDSNNWVYYNREIEQNGYIYAIRCFYDKTSVNRDTYDSWVTKIVQHFEIL